jgi:phage-related baseplate assembly protein
MRFVSPDLASLPPPPAIEGLDFESILASRLADLGARLAAQDLPDVAAVLTLEGEPLVIAQQTGAAFELMLRQRVNEAVRACLWASAEKGQLDQLAATFYGIARLVITPADDATDPPTPAVYESDDDFKARGPISLEAHSSAGPEGAYQYFALQADADVKDAAIYGEEDGAWYGDDEEDLVLAPEALVVVLSHTGDGAADADLLAAVAAGLNQEEVLPITDKVTIEAAAIVRYSIEGVLRFAAGADPAPLVAAATANVQAYCDARHRVSRVHQRLGIGAGMKTTNVEEIELTLKDADGGVIDGDIDPGSKGAAFCTGITITAQVAEDSWRG